MSRYIRKTDVDDVDQVFECIECGAAVYSTSAHDVWHAHLVYDDDGEDPELFSHTYRGAPYIPSVPLPDGFTRLGLGSTS